MDTRVVAFKDLPIGQAFTFTEQHGLRIDGVQVTLANDLLVKVKKRKIPRGFIPILFTTYNALNVSKQIAIQVEPDTPVIVVGKQN